VIVWYFSRRVVTGGLKHISPTKSQRKRIRNHTKKIAKKRLRKSPKGTNGNNTSKPWGTTLNNLYIPKRFIQGIVCRPIILPSCWHKIRTLRQAHSKPSKLASHMSRFQSVPVNFLWKLTKDKVVKYQSLELIGWYQTVPYLRLESHVRLHIAMRSYLPAY
jgi:hypothetical protein